MVVALAQNDVVFGAEPTRAGYTHARIMWVGCGWVDGWVGRWVGGWVRGWVMGAWVGAWVRRWGTGSTHHQPGSK
jgi:hypothetical protein